MKDGECYRLIGLLLSVLLTRGHQALNSPRTPVALGSAALAAAVAVTGEATGISHVRLTLCYV